MQVGLAGPLQVVHQIHAGNRIDVRRTEYHLVAESGGQVVTPRRLGVHRPTRKFFVARVDLPEVSERDQGVTHAPHREVGDRVTDVAKLEVENRCQVAVFVVELAAVPQDRGFAAEAEWRGGVPTAKGERARTGV